MIPARNYKLNYLPSIFGDFFTNDWMKQEVKNTPSINMLEDEKSYIIEVAAPGIKKDEVKVHINEENHLLIAMEHKHEEEKTEENKKHYLMREFNYSSFQQALILPKDVNKQDINAKMEDGILTITLPKLTPEQKQQCLQHIDIA